MSREMACVYYDNQKCRKFEEPGYTSWCVLGPCAHQTPSNADRIRAMSDEELATFMAERNVNESTLLLMNEDHGLTAVQIEVLKHRIYCAYMQWLKQPVGDDDTDCHGRKRPRNDNRYGE